MGKDFTQVRKDASQEAGRMLKKVYAGKGKIQANYYLVTNRSYNDAGVVVTLSAKDKDGGKATSAGKKLKAELEGVKFSSSGFRLAMPIFSSKNDLFLVTTRDIIQKSKFLSRIR